MAHPLADVEHGGLVALALADDDGAGDVDRLHLLAHGLHCHLVGVLAVTLAHGAGGRDGGALHHAHELERKVVADHPWSSFKLRCGGYFWYAGSSTRRALSWRKPRA